MEPSDLRNNRDGVSRSGSGRAGPSTHGGSRCELRRVVIVFPTQSNAFCFREKTERWSSVRNQCKEQLSITASTTRPNPDLKSPNPVKAIQISDVDDFLRRYAAIPCACECGRIWRAP
jgi:hypothetical protein